MGVSRDDEEQEQAEREQDRRDLRAGRDGRRQKQPLEDAKALMRWLGILVGIFSLGTPIFLAGYNWAQVREVASAQASIQSTLTADYQRKDVAGQQYGALVGRLDDLARQIERMQATIDGNPGRRARLP